MHMQRSPKPDTNQLGTYLDAVDKAATPPRQDIAAPTYGGPQRDAINSVVDGIVGDICSKVADLRKMLDTIEQQALQSAAKSKHRLNEHVETCVKINDEIVHMREVVADLMEAASHDA